MYRKYNCRIYFIVEIIIDNRFYSECNYSICYCNYSGKIEF